VPRRGRRECQPRFPRTSPAKYEDYILKALSHYKNGKRKNPIMAAQVANLSPKDMLDLAAYFSHQPGLVVKH
jgi:cytochrome c553